MNYNTTYYGSCYGTNSIEIEKNFKLMIYLQKKYPEYDYYFSQRNQGKKILGERYGYSFYSLNSNTINIVPIRNSLKSS